jgi:hypothetical protein
MTIKLTAIDAVDAKQMYNENNNWVYSTCIICEKDMYGVDAPAIHRAFSGCTMDAK